MRNLFQKVSSHWVRYSEYVLYEAEDGTLYVGAAENAKPEILDPLKNPEQMVLDALNVGMLQMQRADEEKVQDAVIQFVSQYGLLGFMTALPTTPRFTDYDAVYLPKNHFIRAESMPMMEYIDQFFPFEKLDFQLGKGGEFSWNFDTAKHDKDMIALAMTFDSCPLAQSMSFQREYAERYDWLATQFKDWAFTFVGSFLYYHDKKTIEEESLIGYKLGVAAFGGVMPTYHIELLDKPTIVWDFHSLSLGIQMMFSFMLTDEKSPIRLCKQCETVFLGNRADAKFCSTKCKNQYGVDKHRGKK